MLLQRLFRFRYSLRALLVVITLFALWGGYHANRGWKERRALEVLQRHGAIVDLAHSIQGGGLIRSGKCLYWSLTGYLWNDRCIGQVQVYSPLDGELTNALANLPSLESLCLLLRPSVELDLISVKIGEEPTTRSELPHGSLERVLVNGKVRELTVYACELSDDDCRAINRCRSLRDLDLAKQKRCQEPFCLGRPRGRIVD
jgi:hypothetical protein